MMLTVLVESALRSLLLGSAVLVGFRLFRVRNPRVHMICWIMVLAASLTMPLLMHWATVTVTLDALPLPSAESLRPAGTPLPEPSGASPATEFGMPVAAHVATFATVDWWALATAIYACVAAILLLRLGLGIYLTWHLARAAKPMHEPWTANWRVRVCEAIGGPVTFGSTILLPPQCTDWSLTKRRAVLAHEGAHVVNRDFYVLLLASLNRAVFWFSPFAWWQLIRLAELAEIISDAQAVEILDDRLGYAEILLDLVRHVRQAPAGLEMARPCTVRSRIERILAPTTDPARLGWRKRIWTAAILLPVVVASAGSIAYRTPPMSEREGEETTAAAQRPQHVAFYSWDRISIFAVFRQGDDLFGQLSGQRKLRLSVESDGTYSYPTSAGQITVAVNDERQPTELRLRQNGRDLPAARIAEVLGQAGEADASRLESYVGWYELAPNRVLTVTRVGGRLSVQETGRPKFEVVADGADAFADRHDDLVVFLRDGRSQVTQMLLQEPAPGARLAPRVDLAKAKSIEAEFARRIAEVPDRFREQAPQPGSREAVLRGIEDMQNGAPNYDRMSASLAAKIRRQVSQMQPMLKALGAVETIYFRGVGPGGYDIYGVKFANGFAEFRLLLGADGKADDVTFRADGDDTLGGIVACSSEQELKSPTGAAPIHLLFYNATGADIKLYRLDAEGKRNVHGAIGENMSSSILTAVDNPWVVTDASGKCLQIVLPGQSTRYLTIEEPGANGQSEHSVSRRAAPMAGSEEMLRQYIEALGRGEPNYDRMTSEVAAQTRQQLPFNQAILSRLGALRAVSFRGVTGMGSDIYMANFANGTAEWRIALAKDGTIGRIALGPQ